jgi:catalase
MLPRLELHPRQKTSRSLLARGSIWVRIITRLRIDQALLPQSTGVWDVKAQLALESANPKAEDFPIETADKPWPEGKSPWQTVGTITVGPQDTYSDARQLFVDEQLSFSPWHALEDHRPLGGIMRSRLKAYEEARKYRAQRNARHIVEPREIGEVPA